VVTLKINGMKCGHCSGTVTKALEVINGITNVKVDLTKNEVHYLEDFAVHLDKLKESITTIGFEVVG
jgi:copper chaperone CopZ